MLRSPIEPVFASSKEEALSDELEPHPGESSNGSLYSPTKNSTAWEATEGEVETRDVGLLGGPDRSA